MVNISINDGPVREIREEIEKGFASLTRIDKAIRTAALGLLALQQKRIHGEGKNSKGQPIGVYSKAYIKKRLRKGLQGKKVIIRFTSQLQSDFKVEAVEGGYALGFSNPINGKKADYMTERYGPIWEPTEAEEKKALEIIDNALKDA
jgi:hypothetical protein